MSAESLIRYGSLGWVPSHNLSTITCMIGAILEQVQVVVAHEQTSKTVGIHHSGLWTRRTGDNLLD